MRTLLSLAVAAGLIAGASMAAETAKAPKPKHAMGKVESVNAAANSVVVKTAKNATLTVVVNAQTKITKAGKAATLADLAAGDSVKVSYTVGADKSNTATEITVKAPKAPAKK